MDHPIDNDTPERLYKIYASQEALEKKVLSMEERVARSARAIIKAGSRLEDVELLRELERNLEWFLTWRLKLAGTRTTMWCDGVVDLAIHSMGAGSYEISAKAYVGPESDASTTLCDICGTIAPDENVDRLKNYSLAISYRNEVFVITDVI